MTTFLHETFLQLIRLGIGTSKDATIANDIDWVALKVLAKQHGLSAVVLDGIDKLNTNGLPLQMKLKWIGQVMQEEQRYSIQWQMSCDLANLLAKEGIKTYVLKGVVVSECYPSPKHRCSVDLDCYLKSNTGNKDVWETGNAVVEQAGYKVERDFYKNSTFILPGLIVENHKYLTPFRGNKNLTAFEQLLQELFRQDQGEDCFESTNLYRPSVMITALFLIEHAYSHFLHEGLTWRHVLDWMMFSKRHDNEIEWNQLDKWIDEFGFRGFYNSFLSIGRYLLGEIVEEELSDKDNLLLSDIWAPLDLHETVRGVKGKFALAGNTWRARWKYRYFTEMSWITALWIQVKGFLFMKEPKLS